VQLDDKVLETRVKLAGTLRRAEVIRDETVALVK
jgi:hypothetical protein